MSPAVRDGLFALLASSSVHAGVCWLGLLSSREPPPRGRTQSLAIEIREVPPPPAPVDKAPPPAAVAPPPPKLKAPHPPPRPEPLTSDVEPAEAPLPAPPAPVVGLSPSSMSEQPGGPVFAAGNTLEGATAPVAVAAGDIAPVKPITPSPTNASGSSRRADLLPRRQRPIKPGYPTLLERQGVEADVLVSVQLDASGRVTSVRIVRPARDAEFNEAATRAAWREVFDPARRGGEPVPYTLSFTYRFRLEER